jgi:hypothetical protein
MSARNANFILKALGQSGELVVRKNEGPRGTNRYCVVTGVKPTSSQPLKPASPLKGASPLKPASLTPEAGFPKPLKPASDKPSLNHQEPPVKKKRTRTSSRASTPVALISKFPEFQTVDVEAIETWLAIRKDKRQADLTAIGLRALIREGEKVGMTLAQVIVCCCENGWAGFKAKWMEDASGLNKQEALDRGNSIAARRWADSGETAYQRNQRETVARFAPGVARKAPGQRPKHSGFADLDYHAGIDVEGRIVETVDLPPEAA